MSVSDNTKEKVQRIVKLVHEHLKVVRKDTPGQILYNFLSETGAMESLVNTD